MKNIKISIIINIDDSIYLTECLDSLISQRFKNIELFFVNSQQYDLKPIIAKYENEFSNIFIVNEKNFNIAYTTVIKQISGKYLLFLDSNDFLLSDSLKTLYEKAELKQSDILLFKSIDFLNSYDTYQSNEYDPILNEYVNKTFNVDDINKQLLFNLDTNIKIFYLTSFLKKNISLFSNNTIQIDYMLNFKSLFFANKISYTDYAFYAKRIFNKNDKYHKIDLNDFCVMLSNYISFFIIYKKFYSFKRYILNKYVSIVKNYFYSLSEEDKYNYFKSIKQILIKYDFITYNDYYENINPENTIFISLMQKSMSYQDYKINIDIEKNKNQQLLSVIMPIYNGKKDIIKKAFESIYYQTIGFKNIELIMVDDASSDDEGKNYIRKLSDLYPNVISIFLDRNKGSGNARNQGIKIASTNYIMFLDHDDTYTENACKVLFDNIINEDVDVVSGNYVNNTPGAHRIIHWEKRNIPDLYTKIHNLHENPNLLKIYPSIWCKIFKKSFLLDNGIKFKNFRAGQDLIFYQEVLCKVNSMKFIKDIIVNYSFRKGNSINNGSISLNRSKNILKEYIRVYYKSYSLIHNEIPEYSYIPLNNINGWVNNKLFETNFNFKDFKEICEYSKDLFELFNNNEKNKPVKKYEKIYEYISENQIELAYEFYQKHQKINN